MSSAKRTTRTELSASLALPTSGCAKPDVLETELSSSCKVEGKRYPERVRRHNMRVPVLDKEMRPLMPTTAVRARLLLSRGQASAYRNKLGIFSIILKKTVVPNNQPLALGIDPGSSFEGWSVVGAKATVLNGTSKTPKHVKDAIEQRRVMRRARRSRNCRRRQCRSNRNITKSLPPSTFARWNAKVRIIKQLCNILPISDVSVEDVAAPTKKGKDIGWNSRFSPIEQGKKWFYKQIRDLGLRLTLYKGTETKGYRNFYRLSKSKNKGEKSFSAHAVDAWVLAATVVGAVHPTDRRLYYWTPVVSSKRALHRAIPQKGGIRTRYGGTQCLGVTKGTLVRYRGIIKYVSGYQKERLNLNNASTGKRTDRSAKVSDVSVLTRIAFRTEVINGGRASATV
ncbi:MAG: RRXRR domain-containing protein [Candidatus Thermoplasmatota archaeon]